MKVFFAILAACLFLMMIGEKQGERMRYYTYGFLGAILGTLALYIIG